MKSQFRDSAAFGMRVIRRFLVVWWLILATLRFHLLVLWVNPQVTVSLLAIGQPQQAAMRTTRLIVWLGQHRKPSVFGMVVDYPQKLNGNSPRAVLMEGSSHGEHAQMISSRA
jgi:hypothetical protein